jgi:hypothetical protein
MASQGQWETKELGMTERNDGVCDPATGSERALDIQDGAMTLEEKRRLVQSDLCSQELSDFVHVSGVLVYGGEVYTIIAPKPLLVLDMISWANAIRENYSLESHDAIREGDVENARLIDGIVDCVDAWISNPTGSVSSFDLDFEIRAAFQPYRVNRGNLISYLEQLMSVSFEVPRCGGLGDSVADFYLPKFLFEADSVEPCLYVLKGGGVNYVVSHTGSEFGGVLVEEEELSRRILDHAVASHGLVSPEGQARVAPKAKPRHKPMPQKNKRGESRAGNMTCGT